MSPITETFPAPRGALPAYTRARAYAREIRDETVSEIRDETGAEMIGNAGKRQETIRTVTGNGEETPR